MKWLCLPTISAPMPLQMALDEVLFGSQKKEARDPVLRFYISSEPWISAGCSFRDAPALSGSELVRKSPGVPVTRRITGGGCVLHGEDVIFSLIARYGEAPSLASVRASYQKIHDGVRMAFGRCGLDARFYAPEADLPKGSDCFDFPVASDLEWKGRKVAGGAQKRSHGVLLHHESVRLREGVSRDVLIAALRQGLAEVFGVTIEPADLDPALFFEAAKVIRGK